MYIYLFAIWADPFEILIIEYTIYSILAIECKRGGDESVFPNFTQILAAEMMAAKSEAVEALVSLSLQPGPAEISEESEEREQEQALQRESDEVEPGSVVEPLDSGPGLG